MKYFFLISVCVTAGIVGAGLWVFHDELFTINSSRIEPISLEDHLVVSSQETSNFSSSRVTREERDNVGENDVTNSGGNARLGVLLLDVPFVPQAPFGNWEDARLQNGCEEAAMLMAVAWGRDEVLDFKRAEKEIFALAKFQEEKIGHFLDTSAHDTTQLMKEYFGYDGVRAESGITIDEIRSELERGNLVIVPVNGRRIGNPFYTSPGPLTHMLVIRGYDYDTKEFITNDPGTRRGELFRYTEGTLREALQDYPTGYHESQEPGKTGMIIVEKEIDTLRP